MPSLEEYKAACQTIDDWIMDPNSDWNELESDLPVEKQLRGIICAIRCMLRTGPGESVLDRCATVIRRHDQMYAKLGNYGSSIKIEESEGRIIVKNEDGQHG
jgi:hypothetical protein